MFGPLFIPTSIVGWLATLWTAFVAVSTFGMVDRHSHSNSDTLINAVPIIGAMLVLLWLLARRSSR
jgi:hypothetical protein